MYELDEKIALTFNPLVSAQRTVAPSRCSTRRSLSSTRSSVQPHERKAAPWYPRD